MAKLNSSPVRVDPEMKKMLQDIANRNKISIRAASMQMVRKLKNINIKFKMDDINF